jgi:Protein of unknown function (DUF1822)
MKNLNKTDDISKLIDTYPEHGWIDLTEFPEYSIDDDTTPADLNLQCKAIIKEWLQESMGLPSKEDSPYSGSPERLVSQLVNGFCLKIKKSKVIFIPSEQIDISSFEVAQEWVDLPEWMGDYYVPIQVDVDAQHLHLWGMITHQELKQVEEPDDKKFRYYNVDADRTIDNLEVLWTSCELAPEPRSKNIPMLMFCAGHGVAKQLIDRVKSETESNFERLVLAFEQWGAILNDPGYLNQYLQPEAVLVTVSPKQAITTFLGGWLDETAAKMYQDWKTLEEYISPRQPAIVFRDSSPALKSRLAPNHVRGVALDTPERIDRQVKRLYTGQNPEFSIVELPTHIQEPAELLAYLSQHTSDDNLRWRALECLWTIEPNHQLAKYRRFKDLETFTQGRSLNLMIAVTKRNEKQLSILARVYPIDRQSTLPPNLQLLLLDENDNLATEQPIISQTYPLDDYIDVNFYADSDYPFSISIKLDDIIYTESFII